MKLLVALLPILFCIAVAPAFAADGQATPQEIDKLIAQLESEDFDTRQAATEKLKSAGEGALEALHKASVGGNAEAAFRAPKVIASIQKTLAGPLRVMEGKQGRILCVAFDQVSMKIASGSYDASIRICDVATGKELHRLEGHKDIVFAVAFSPDGGHLLSCSGGSFVKGVWGEGGDYTIRLWSLKTGKEVRQLGEQQKDWVMALAFSPDGKTAASGNRNKDTVVRLWNVETGKEIKQFKGHTGAMRSIAFSPDGAALATAADDQTIRTWNVSTGKELKVFAGHRGVVNRVAYSADGKTLISASQDYTIRTWNPENGKELTQSEGRGGIVLKLTFAEGGTRGLSSCADETIRVWNLASGAELRRFEGRAGISDAMASSADGKFLATGSLDGTVRIWKMPP